MKILRILSFIQRRVKALGIRLIYSVLLMVYAYQSDRTPVWARRIIMGALAYLLSPLDSIPDLTPFIGFTDDLGIISFGLVSIACYIDKDVREKAKTKLLSLIKDVDEKEILAVDAKL
ncbi:MAG: DUF1232 domain-containing protein [Saprospiraceae bacterium]|nr:DUF1232 domain-containing protein [Saprospiraceae bacterium]